MQINSKAVVWSKKGNCPWCSMAKAYLEAKNIKVEERVVDTADDMADFLLAVPNARTVPQIFIDGEYIGGYQDLLKYFIENDNYKDPKVE